MLDYDPVRRIIRNKPSRKRKVTNKLMKKTAVLTWLLVFSGLLVCAVAFAKKEKVGIIENGWYSDSRFGFSIAIPAEWKDAGLKNEPTPERIMFEWRKPRIPIKLKSNPGEALRPFVRIFADSTGLSTREFFDSLNVGSTKDAFRDRILSKSIFFQRGMSNPPEIEPPTIEEIGGFDATRWHIRREYSVQVQRDEITPPELVRDYRVGYVYIVGFDGWLLYMEMACENQFRDELEDQFKKVASMLTFRAAPASTDSTKAAEGGAEK